MREQLVVSLRFNDLVRLLLQAGGEIEFVSGPAVHVGDLGDLWRGVGLLRRKLDVQRVKGFLIQLLHICYGLFCLCACDVSVNQCQ